MPLQLPNSQESPDQESLILDPHGFRSLSRDCHLYELDLSSSVGFFFFNNCQSPELDNYKFKFQFLKICIFAVEQCLYNSVIVTVTHYLYIFYIQFYEDKLGLEKKLLFSMRALFLLIFLFFWTDLPAIEFTLSDLH